MTTKSIGATLPSYKFAIISDTVGSIQVSTAGDFTAKDTWQLIPGGLSPVNAAPVTAVAPQVATIKGQNAAASFASTGGDVILSPGTGSVSNVSGNVTIQDTAGNAGWNTAHLKIGIYHLWVDSSSRLRVKNSAPTSDTDGTVVGTQS
jgi:aconitase B